MANSRVGIIGVLQNPSLSKTSHNAGWTYVYKSMLEEIGYNVTILNHKDDWDVYDQLWINEGVNFKQNQWNIFGGVSDDLVNRLNKLNNYKGNVFVWGHDKPVYKELCEKRNIDLVFSKEITEMTKIIDSKKKIVGDSHSISVYEPGWEIDRKDGKTLFGFLRESKSFNYYGLDSIRLYFGNIDVRHHLLRHNNQDTFHDLFSKLLVFVSNLRLEGVKVEIVDLLPIENEIRKLPKSGQYEGLNFFGSWKDRVKIRHDLSRVLEDVCIQTKSRFLKWPDNYKNDLGELKFDHMEARQSVHLRPSSYMFKYKFIEECKNPTLFS